MHIFVDVAFNDTFGAGKEQTVAVRRFHGKEVVTAHENGSYGMRGRRVKAEAYGEVRVFFF